MNGSAYPSVDERTFVQVLRRAVSETWSEIQLLLKNPKASPFFFESEFVSLDMVFTLTRYLQHLKEMAEDRRAAVPLSANQRHERYLGQVFMDEGSEFGRVPLMRALHELDSFWLHNGQAWVVPAEGVFDDASSAALAAFTPWSQQYLAERRSRIEAAQKAKRAAARARLPPSRLLPHDPDPESIEIYRHASRDELARWQPRLPGTDGLGNPTAESARHLAEQHLIQALTGHWFLKPVAETLAAMRRGCDYAVRGLPHDPTLHAWTYEQWQHIAIVAGHQALLDTLWGLRQEAWDTNRIRPVNWLVCRIRLLDLLHRGGAPDEVKDLLEKQRLGLFVEHLPSELEVDLPLMRNWYHVLRGIVLRDPALIAERLTERQRLLADHWTRGGGIAPVSLLDIGGWALLRSARRRGLTITLAESAYLPQAVLDTSETDSHSSA
jgi:hypothetical protein